MTTLVLGRIKEISFYDLQVSLIEGRTGTVKVYNISNRYKTMLESVVRGEQPKDMPVLTDMFSIGQYLPCLIVSQSVENDSAANTAAAAKNGNSASKKSKLQLSANPRDVNKGVPMHQLNSRMLLYGSIDSVEDHGFTIDLGVPGLVGFLPKSETADYIACCNSGRPLCVGGLVPVRLLDDNSDSWTSSSTASSAMSLSLGETRTARLTCNPAKLMSPERAWPETVPCSFDCLVPGVWLRARVHRIVEATRLKAKSACLIAQFQPGTGGGFVCSVPKSHLPNKLATYKQGEPIVITVVSIDQSTKTLIGSCLPHTLPPSEADKSAEDADNKDNIVDVETVMQTKSKKAKIQKKKKKTSAANNTDKQPPFPPSYYSIGRVSVGQVVEDAVVSKVGGGGATLWLPTAKLVCLVGPKQMPGADTAEPEQQQQQQQSSDGKQKEKKQKKKKKSAGSGGDSKVGDVVKVRILDVSPMDNVVFGSLRESVLGLPFLRYEDVQLAAPVTGTLLRYCKEGAVFRVARSLRGLVPYLHLSDYPAGHKRHQHLEPGTQLNCRVLSASSVDRKLILTAKPSLVRSSSQTPIVRVEQLVPGVLADCFVAKLDSNGILLAFYGLAKAWAPRTQLGLADSDSIEQVYYRGQVLRVRIIKPAVGDRLPVASLLLEGKKSPAESQAAKLRKQLKQQLDASIGSLCSCRILARQNGSFRVALTTLNKEADSSNSNSIEALLPFEHLTDQAVYAQAIAEIRRIGDIVSPCVVWSIDAGIVVSAKPSLTRLASTEAAAGFPIEFDSIEVGDLLFGLADQFKPYGLFVQLLAGFRGLAPVRTIASEHPPFPLKDLFKPGQTVLAKVLEKNAEKRRCLLSLRVRDCARPGRDLDDSLRLLEETIDLLDSGGLCPHKALLPGSLVRVAAAPSDQNNQIRQFRLLDAELANLKGSKNSKTKQYTCTASANQLLGADCTPGSRHTALVLSVNPIDKSVSLCLRPDLLNDLAAAQSTVRVADVSPGEAYAAEVLYAGQDYRLLALRLGPTTQQVAFLPARRHWNESYSASSPNVGSRVQVVVQRVIRSGGDSANEARIYRLVALQSEVSRAEAFRHLAPSSSANAAKTGSGLSKRDISVGEAFVVRVVAITNCQLNVEDLHSRTKGRIFITEVTDSPQQLVNPLAAFSVGQELLARVVGVRADRYHEDPSLPLSGKRSNLYEMSARPSVLARSGNDFKDLFELPSESVGSMWLFVQHADPKNRHVAMYAAIGKILTVPYLDVTDDIDKLANLSKSLPCGVAFQAWRLPSLTGPIEAQNDDDREAGTHPSPCRVTCLGPEACQPLKAGDRVAAFINSASQFYYRANLPGGQLGQFHFMDLHSDRPADIGDLRDAAARQYRLPSRTSRRRAPAILAEVIRVVDRRHYWLRPVDAPSTNSTSTSTSALIGYVVRHCDRGLAVTFGGSARTGLVSVPRRALRLFPVGRRVQCSAIPGAADDADDDNADENSRRYRLEEPIPAPVTSSSSASASASISTLASKKRKTTDKLDEDSATATNKRQRRRLSTSVGDSSTGTDDEANKVVIVVHSDKDRAADESGLYLPLELADQADDDTDQEVRASPPTCSVAKQQRSSSSSKTKQSISREQYESLVAREPNNANHWVNYSRYYADAGELDSARSTIERGLVAVGRLGSAGDDADAGRRRLLRCLLLLESKAADESNDDPEALDRLNQATHRACQMQDPGLTRLAVSKLLDRGEADKAEAAAAKLRRARPDCPTAWRLQLEVKLRRNRGDDAKRLLFDQALSALPKRHHLGLLSGYAELACRHGRRADGVATFESLIQSHPGRPELYLLYGRCLLLGGGGGAVGVAAASDLLAKARDALPDKSCSQLTALAELIAEASSSTTAVEASATNSDAAPTPSGLFGDASLTLME